MSDLENLYKSPETQIVPEQKQSAGNLTEPMLQFLRGASPWMRFVGIVGFVGSGICVVFGLISLFFSNSISSLLSEDFMNTPIWLASLSYALSGVVLFFPSFFTYKTGTMIRKFIYSNTDADLEEALKNNKALWKFYGIITIIFLAFIPVVIILSVIIGIAAVFQL